MNTDTTLGPDQGPDPATAARTMSTAQHVRALRAATDRDLVSAIVGHDELALGELLGRYDRYLWQTAYHYVGREHVAHDVVAIVGDIVWRKAAQYRGDSLVTTWLYRVTANAAFDLIRRERTRHEVPVAFGPGNDVPMPVLAGRDDVATDVAARDLVAHLLAELPDAHRRAVQLVDLDGHSVAEAAAVLGCAEGTVKSRRARAFRALAARWTVDGDRSRRAR